MSIKSVMNSYSKTIKHDAQIVKQSLKQTGKEFKQGWHDESHMVAKSFNKAVKDTFSPLGLGTAGLIGVSEGRTAGTSTLKSLGNVGKGAAKGAVVEVAIRFTSNLVKNQLKYDHSFR